MSDYSLLKQALDAMRALPPQERTEEKAYEITQRYATDDILHVYIYDELQRYVEQHPDQTLTDDLIPHIQPIDWTKLAEHDYQIEWLVEPLLPKGRLVALYAQGKAGKSLLCLEIAAAVATGNRTLDQPPGEPQDVVYLDYEMTPEDLQERLETFGYNPAVFRKFHYYQLPDLAPLDTEEGGDQLEAIAQRHRPALVILDTVARVVEGEENSADTYKALYRNSLQRLKARGITVIRLDHAGKNARRGQRGSSAKNDDADVVWELTKQDEVSLILKATRRRMSWVPELVNLKRLEDQEILRHVTDRVVLTSKQQMILMEFLSRGVPADMPIRGIRKFLGKSYANTDVSAVQKYRRQQAGDTPNPPPPNPQEPQDSTSLPPEDVQGPQTPGNVTEPKESHGDGSLTVEDVGVLRMRDDNMQPVYHPEGPPSEVQEHIYPEPPSENIAFLERSSMNITQPETGTDLNRNADVSSIDGTQPGTGTGLKRNVPGIDGGHRRVGSWGTIAPPNGGNVPEPHTEPTGTEILVYQPPNPVEWSLQHPGDIVFDAETGQTLRNGQPYHQYGKDP